MGKGVTEELHGEILEVLLNGRDTVVDAKLGDDDTNRVADQLSEVMVRLRDTSRSLKTATGEILIGANDLSERTTRQRGRA